MGDVGFHPVTPLIAEFEEIAPYVTPAALNTVELPADGIRIVHVGANDELNFVKAVSVTFPTFTKPVSASVESATSHDRCALIPELRTTFVIAPVLLTFTSMPSRVPASI